MEIEVKIKVPADAPPDAEALARQALLLFAAKLIEAVTRNGNGNSVPPKGST